MPLNFIFIFILRSDHLSGNTRNVLFCLITLPLSHHCFLSLPVSFFYHAWHLLPQVLKSNRGSLGKSNRGSVGSSSEFPTEEDAMDELPEEYLIVCSRRFLLMRGIIGKISPRL